MADLSSRLRALRAQSTGSLRDALDVLQDGVNAEHLQEEQLDDAIYYLSKSMDWGSDELGFDPHGELLCVSFLDDEACCEHEALINALRALKA